VSAQTKSFPAEAVEIPAGTRRLKGLLSIPSEAAAIVLFAHGSGSSRLSSRNQFVASLLNRAGVATLLFDLLDEAEAEDRENVFDILLLAQRLEEAAAWSRARPQMRDCRLGYFGASTGAAAALVAAAHGPALVDAVVSRGGRPDLATEFLPRVEAPTLLIVGENDDVVVELNRQAFDGLRCEKRLEIVPGATHLFAEPGALEQVAELASKWFERHLVPSRPAKPVRS